MLCNCAIQPYGWSYKSPSDRAPVALGMRRHDLGYNHWRRIRLPSSLCPTWLSVRMTSAAYIITARSSGYRHAHALPVRAWRFVPLLHRIHRSHISAQARKEWRPGRFVCCISQRPGGPNDCRQVGPGHALQRLPAGCRHAQNSLPARADARTEPPCDCRRQTVEVEVLCRRDRDDVGADRSSASFPDIGRVRPWNMAGQTIKAGKLRVFKYLIRTLIIEGGNRVKQAADFRKNQVSCRSFK